MRPWAYREVIAALRAEVDEHLQPGMPAMRCRVCRQRVHLDKRAMNSGMVRALIRLARHARQFGRGREKDEFMDYRNWNARAEARDHTLLRHTDNPEGPGGYWGLIVADATRPPGWWKITERGLAFVREEIRVPRAMYYFDTRCYGFTKKKTGIRKALGTKFDLDELMRDNEPE
jgi:hypothetical protein